MGIKKFDFSFFFNHSINASLENNSNNLILNKDLLAIPVQNHTANVLFVKKPGLYQNIDGLITSKKYNLILSIKVADCVPIYVYDPITDNFGIFHSGWKGTKNKIIVKGISILVNKFKCLPRNILVVIGPYIKSCCYVVDSDVAKYFNHDSINKYKEKWKLDLGLQIKLDLVTEGLLDKNIYISDICTYDTLACESYRRDGDKSGRMIGLMG